MKKIFLSFFIICLAIVTAKSQVVFPTSHHNFGNIRINHPVSYVFTFKNTSDKPLVIENAEASCGCTTPSYTKLPIRKNQTGKIKVTFNAEAPGNFTKTVNVKFSGIQRPIILTIQGKGVPSGRKK